MNETLTSVPQEQMDHAYPHHFGDVTAEQLSQDIALHPKAYDKGLDRFMLANGIDVNRPTRADGEVVTTDELEAIEAIGEDAIRDTQIVEAVGEDATDAYFDGDASLLSEIGQEPLKSISPDTFVVAPGSLQSTWKERSEASEHVRGGVAMADGNPGTTIGELGHQLGYTVDKVPTVLPLPGSTMQREWYRNVSDMTKDEREMYGLAAEGKTSDFQELSPDAKQSLFTDRIRLIEQVSQDVSTRGAAIQANLERVETGHVVEPTDYIHGFKVKNLRQIMNDGLLAGEAVGMQDGKVPGSDQYPYNLDLFSASDLGAIAENNTLNMERTGEYGEVVAVVDRAEGTTDHDNEVTVGPNGYKQKLIFGGVPSTEIRSLHVRRPENRGYNQSLYDHEYQENCNEAINTVIAEGFYIPIYDADGTLLLSYDDYAKRHAAKDYSEEYQRSPAPASEPQDGGLIF